MMTHVADKISFLLQTHQVLGIDDGHSVHQQ